MFLIIRACSGAAVVDARKRGFESCAGKDAAVASAPVSMSICASIGALVVKARLRIDHRLRQCWRSRLLGFAVAVADDRDCSAFKV